MFFVHGSYLKNERGYQADKQYQVPCGVTPAPHFFFFTGCQINANDKPVGLFRPCQITKIKE